MKQKSKSTRWFVLAFVLLGLLLSTAAVAANYDRSVPISDGGARRQVVQRLITHFADSRCTQHEANPDQEGFNFSQPVRDCRLISQTHSAFNYSY
jgi:hypothetical protein